VTEIQLLEPVRTETTVPLSPAEAFKLFTDGLDRWWVRGHHIGDAPLLQAVLEGHVGGRWYEIGEDGSECDWGRVLAWEPPTRLVLAWQINAEWKYDAGLVTEVEVGFSDLGDGSTRVTLEHRNLDRFGPSALKMQQTFGGANAWSGLLKAYHDAAL
jgi:uncharacterized protein YndB with AHSA1/START domain